MIKESDHSDRKGHTRVQWAVTLLVDLALLTYGMQSSWLSPMAKILQSPESPMGRPLADTEISLIAGAIAIAGTFSIFIFVYVVDKYGRKCAVILTVVFQLMGWLFTIYPSNFPSLIVARLFCGLGGGGCFHVIPMYVKEVSQDSIRGTLGAMLTLFQNLGIIVMYGMGAYLDYYTTVYIMIGIPVLNILLLLKVPESPSFLVKVGKMEEAAKTIASLKGLEVNDKKVHADVDSLKREDDYFKSIPNISFLKIFKIKAWRRGFIILVVIIIFRAINGFLAVTNYAASILTASELNISPEVQSLALPVFLTIGALITLAFINTLGRKILLILNFIISAVAFSGFASSLLLSDLGWNTPRWLPIVALAAAASCYGGGVSPIPFIVMAEMFNFQIRAKLMACLSILSWFLNFLQLLFFTPLSNSAGPSTTFYIFGAINAMGAITALIYLPETGGKSIEQIEKELGKEKELENKNTEC